MIPRRTEQTQRAHLTAHNQRVAQTIFEQQVRHFLRDLTGDSDAEW